MMVAGLPKTRTNSDAERAQLSEARAALTSIRDRLLVLADQDTEAYNSVVAAFRLPKSTDAEKAARKQAIAAGMRAATDIPLETLRTAAEACAHGKVVAQYGNPSASSDVRVALELLEASSAGAAANVEVNLTSLDDEAFRKSAASSMIDLGNQHYRSGGRRSRGASARAVGVATARAGRCSQRLTASSTLSGRTTRMLAFTSNSWMRA